MRGELAAAVAAAREAGALLAEGFGRPRTVEFKRAADPVTEMDRRAERRIRDLLHAQFPHHGFLGEEGQGDRDAPLRWIVDPLDGTTNYAHHHPHFCVSIALEQEREILLGIVHDPLRNELFHACRGEGAFRNGRRIAVSGRRRPAEALLGSGFPYDAWHANDDNTAEWTWMIKRVASLRCSGSAALDLAYVACGRLDGFWERGLAPWDMAAGVLLVREAGGIVTATDGGPFDLAEARILAATPELHPFLVRELAAARMSCSPSGG